MAMLAHTGTPKQRKMAYEFLRADQAAGKFSKAPKAKTKPKSKPKSKPKAKRTKR